MTYVKVEDGVVVEVKENTSDKFVFRYRKTFKSFSLWIRVDLLDPVPAVGWTYDSNSKTFTAP